MWQKKEIPLVLEKLSSTQKSSRLSKQHIKIISKKKRNSKFKCKRTYITTQKCNLFKTRNIIL
uniref:Uncharacterized protein n=1 Tax=Borreliella burgdorferi TaxID=139 RepID=Q9ZIY7_BORBG|nr:unknown [Borreliella burgdorferi N40]